MGRVSKTPSNTKQVTIREVASKALVSVGTVSRVFNNQPNVENDLRLRVLGAATELGYIHRGRTTKATAAKEAARKDNDGSNKISHVAFCCRTGIGFTSSVIHNPYFGLILNGVEIECRRHKLHLIFHVVEDAPGEFTNFQESLQRSVADAILLANFTNSALINNIPKLNMPVVLMDHYYPGVPMDVVMNENYGGSYQAVQYLVSKGHRKIGFINGLPHYTIQRRMDGYRKALEDAGLEFDPSLIVPCNLSIEDGRRAADRAIAAGVECSAYLCANDSSAIGFIQRMLELGRRVPDDFSIIGFDNIEMSGLISPPLTTIDTNPVAVGRIAVRTLLDRVKDPSLPFMQHLLPSNLVARGSVAAPNAKFLAGL